ncbi:5-formyltetrahydrofolate cyclo-ligase [Inhella proteolytica]|uniref:5-formyltetrahydrofolate cyclo-ligase n=1 Tax=Inhella proteolytica TaxID=2795029 RepID=A0A931J8U7_9BURK|nr:5-formyltetrahydrofolate cyclo-ligase [Inhella proteolytica]MBH9578220.1 5-formyltetrahydrofolate cyclo-ligase [Inhella proteolytica]
MDAIEHQNPAPERQALRRELKARRSSWLASPAGAAAAQALNEPLRQLLQQLEPFCLGLYWPLDGEFDAPAFWAHQALPGVQLALPYALREGRKMHYRRWDGRTPSAQDEMGIPCSSGAPVEPDVVLVPCLGFTRTGYRLGYGGGYFDRWLAANPGVTAVGLAWSVGECEFAPAAHDLPLAVILTERELLAP